MAHLANCPQCDHELLVPDGVAAGSWVRCPGCQAFFQLKEARARELPMVEVITSASDPNTEPEFDHSRPTVADFSSSATLADHAQDSAEFDDASEDRATLNLNERSDARPKSYDDLGFRELGALFDSNELSAESQADSHADETIDVDDEHDSEVAQLHVADVEDSDSLDVDNVETAADDEAGEAAPTEESPQAAAERIDAWFRSAKTLAEVPPLENPDVDYHADRESLFGPPPEAANSATVEIGSGGIHEMGDDFEIDAPADSPEDVAAWDDTQHIERLLADVEDERQDEPIVDIDQFGPSQAIQPSGAAWAPGEMPSIVPKQGQARRKRSLLRSLLMTAVGGVMGLAAGYYALLWIRGPEIDFLEVAKYLPSSVLPSSFNPAPSPMAVTPPLQAKTDGAATGASEPLPRPTEETEKADRTTEPVTAATEPPAEKLATFNEPVDTTKLDEPAAFNEPPAAPIGEGVAVGEPIQIKDAPSFTVTEILAALQAGKEAEAGLVTGNLGDSRETDRAKGFSYSILADLAQKSTFVDGGGAGEAEKLHQESDEIFRRILADTHARNEVGQIVLKWIASPNRKQGGVFFAGNVLSCEARGPVSECSITLPGGQTLPVLVPASVAERVKASQSPVAVVGWIANDPGKNVTGYTGSASQAIFSPRLISLE